VVSTRPCMRLERRRHIGRRCYRLVLTHGDDDRVSLALATDEIVVFCVIGLRRGFQAGGNTKSLSGRRTLRSSSRRPAPSVTALASASIRLLPRHAPHMSCTANSITRATLVRSAHHAACKTGAVSANIRVHFRPMWPLTQMVCSSEYSGDGDPIYPIATTWQSHYYFDRQERVFLDLPPRRSKS